MGAAVWQCVHCRCFPEPACVQASKEAPTKEKYELKSKGKGTYKFSPGESLNVRSQMAAAATCTVSTNIFDRHCVLFLFCF